MRLYVAVTDKDWFALHASKPEVEEVNFWRPSPDATFKALQPGELLLFKLHSPDNFITGGGFFTRFLQLPVDLVWDTFGEANGVRSQSEMRGRIAYYRRSPIAAAENPMIGCSMLAEPEYRDDDSGNVNYPIASCFRFPKIEHAAMVAGPRQSLLSQTKPVLRTHPELHVPQYARENRFRTMPYG